MLVPMSNSEVAVIGSAVDAAAEYSNLFRGKIISKQTRSMTNIQNSSQSYICRHHAAATNAPQALSGCQQEQLGSSVSAACDGEFAMMFTDLRWCTWTAISQRNVKRVVRQKTCILQFKIVQPWQSS